MIGLDGRNHCATVISVNDIGLKVAKSLGQPRLATGGRGVERDRVFQESLNEKLETRRPGRVETGNISSVPVCRDVASLLEAIAKKGLRVASRRESPRRCELPVGPLAKGQVTCHKADCTTVLQGN
jgi:hypothetical protein